MGQGLEPLTADLCLSSRSQPPQLPSRTDFFEQSKKKNVFRATAATTTATTTTAQLLTLLLQPSPAGITARRTPLPPRNLLGREQTTVSTRTQVPGGSSATPTAGTTGAIGRNLCCRPLPPLNTTGTTTTTRTAAGVRGSFRWSPHQGHDTRTSLSSMLPDFPSNAHTMEFG